jgi:halimadienyl-diphosphate synthase
LSHLNIGRNWLEEHMDKPYPPLWIGKCLYSPTLVVRSAVIGAMAFMSI